MKDKSDLIAELEAEIIALRKELSELRRGRNDVEYRLQSKIFDRLQKLDMLLDPLGQEHYP